MLLTPPHAPLPPAVPAHTVSSPSRSSLGIQPSSPLGRWGFTAATRTVSREVWFVGVLCLVLVFFFIVNAFHSEIY